MLEISRLSVDHGELRALWDVSFRVEQGERVALLGANGAGKSTTLGAIIGLYRPAGGKISYCGNEIAGRDPADNVEDGIALVPEGRRLFPEMTVRENLEMGAYVRGKRSAVSERIERCYTLFPVLKEKAGQPAGHLSGGQQQMVAIARALLNENRVLLVDEPTKGLAPLLVDQVAEVLDRVSETETILLVEQNLRVVQRLARDAIVLDQGRVVHTGPARELLADAALLRRLLGMSPQAGH
jgi:branched-chain amino acid transport system ATP-binding protein